MTGLCHSPNSMYFRDNKIVKGSTAPYVQEKIRRDARKFLELGHDD